jgi:hypothetical protein
LEVNGSWTGLLADVTGLQLQIEIVFNYDNSKSIDEEGIDNVTLRSVPEPGSLTLACVCAFGSCVGTWRKWRKRSSKIAL